MRLLLPYLQLVRLPNVFTAMADILLGVLATGALPSYWLRFVLILVASCALYCSGMVWNDYFDLEQDKRQRPFRPLPSGKVPMSVARFLGLALMAAGIGLAWLADGSSGEFVPYSLWIALGLSASILAYDAWLKRTWAGPIAMGACRFLNVLLGLSVFPEWVGRWGLVLALVVGVYIVGVTWFARTEAERSRRVQLAAAAAVMLAAMILALVLPVIGEVVRNEDNQPADPMVWLGQLLFPYLLVLFGFYLGLPISRAIEDPLPERVQKAVKRSVLGLVLLDAILATAFVGPIGLTLVALLLPAKYLGRWMYST